MKMMKKLMAILLVSLMAICLLTACDEVAPGKKSDESSKKSVHMGVLSKLGITEDEYKTSIGDEVTYFEELQTMVLALQSKKIDVIGDIPEVVADYITDHDSSIKKSLPKKTEGKIYLRMGILKDNEEVFNIFNDTIKTFVADGTLDKLKEQYIEQYTKTKKEPQPSNMPKVDSTVTLRVAVTGDIPPVDFISADGKPAGFNVGLLAEISKAANVNIELVNVNSGARLMALKEGLVDAVFCVNEGTYVDPTYAKLTNADIPNSILVTTAYYEANRAHLE